MFLPPFQYPDPTIPQRVTTVATTTGTGVQVYTCKKAPTGARETLLEWQWIFEAPEASLTDDATHQEVAKHTKGPTWTWRDGSTVVGEVIMKSVPETGTIPVLLLKAVHPAGSPGGFLAPVGFIRRSAPHGGAAPMKGCDAAHATKVIRVLYTATYTFYKPVS